MAKGNHPFILGAADAGKMMPHGTPTGPVKHVSSTGARLSNAAPNFPLGRASSGRKENGKGAIQRAAGRKLFNNSSSKAPGTATYRRNQ
jgi:hypothetical protein